MVDAIEENSDILPKNYVLIFPLTYHRNDEKYIADLKNRLNEKQINHICYDDFLSEKDLARIRISSDIYITIPKSDAASSSLLEYLLAGNVVLAGDWLPYKYHSDLGLYFHTSSLKNLPNKIRDIIINFNKYKNDTMKNKQIVLNNCSWSYRIKGWEYIFNSLKN